MCVPIRFAYANKGHGRPGTQFFHQIWAGLGHEMHKGAKVASNGRQKNCCISRRTYVKLSKSIHSCHGKFRCGLLDYHLLSCCVILYHIISHTADGNSITLYMTTWILCQELLQRLSEAESRLQQQHGLVWSSGASRMEVKGHGTT